MNRTTSTVADADARRTEVSQYRRAVDEPAVEEVDRMTSSSPFGLRVVGDRVAATVEPLWRDRRASVAAAVAAAALWVGSPDAYEQRA